MIDLHSHLLPGVDDGSRSVDQSSSVLAKMVRDGVTDICLTPHLSRGELAADRLAVRKAKLDRAFVALLPKVPAGMRLHRGIELMLDEPLDVNAVLDRDICIASSRYLLVEFPRTLSVLAMRGLISQVTRRGLIPLVAHPERYAEGTVTEVTSWRDLGAAIQVDATTITESRSSRGERARALLHAGLADILAADNHGDERSLLTASKFLARQGAGLQADLMLTHNPLAILQDRALDPVPPIPAKKRWLRSFTGLLVGRRMN
jgi:protein-tyrosine phosphatase